MILGRWHYIIKLRNNDTVKLRNNGICMNPHFDFGEALQWLRQGEQVARRGWNGNDMFIFLQKGYPSGVPCNKNTAKAANIAEGTMITVLPYLMMKTVDGCFVPWLASQTDLLAEDWYRV